VVEAIARGELDDELGVLGAVINERVRLLATARSILAKIGPPQFIGVRSPSGRGHLRTCSSKRRATTRGTFSPSWSRIQGLQGVVDAGVPGGALPHQAAVVQRPDKRAAHIVVTSQRHRTQACS
jgi:hypothetical protein